MKLLRKKSKEKGVAVSELRQDVITGDWVVIASGRAKRPDDFIEKKEPAAALKTKENDCPFCDPGIKKQEADSLIYSKNENEKDWTLKVFTNKYPAFSRASEIKHREDGIFFSMDGVGFHEVIVTRDHDRGIPQMYKEEVAEVIDSFKTRYLDLMNKKSVNYIMIIENHGSKAGASLAHPHWQLFAIPVVSPGVGLELEGTRVYHRNNRECIFCLMIEQERKEKKRIIAENESFIAFAPFASRAAFEVWIIPKKHTPYFERITEKEEFELAEILKSIVGKYETKLNDIAYNMYLHTSPCDGKDYYYYHWHIELLPKTATWAGFELGTGIEICTIEPEEAAKFLRE